MSTILARAWITSCERSELDGVPQPPYLHKCGAPAVESICVSEQRNAELCGWVEVDDYVSTPPLKYGKLTRVGSGHSYNDDQESYCLHESPPEQTYTPVEITRSGTIVWSAVVDGVAIWDSGAVTDHYLYRNCSDGYLSVRSEYDVDCIDDSDTPPGYDGWFSASHVTKNSALSVTLAQVGCVAGTLDTENRVDTLTLSEADTDTAALDRAAAIAGDSCSSLSEVRTVDYDWTVRTASYALKATNLMIDAIYTARVEIESRPAIKDPEGSGYVDENGDPSEWTSVDDEGAAMIDEYTFTATASDMLVPTTGTWSDANADDEIDADEVTPSIDLPHVEGMEYRIKTVRIELALTDA